MGFVHYKNRISHIFETEIKEKRSWFIANEHKRRGVVFYSVSDNSKVLTGIYK